MYGALSVTEQVSIRQPYCSMERLTGSHTLQTAQENSSGNDSWAKSPADVPPGEVTLFNTFGGQWGYGTEGVVRGGPLGRNPVWWPNRK